MNNSANSLRSSPGDTGEVRSICIADSSKPGTRLARLDGIRAVAVLLVIVYHHAFITKFGWIGVDLFFVLSGFLITTILIRSVGEQHYWRTFYIKRAVRILPPLAILFVAVLLLGHHQSLIGFIGYLIFLGNFVAVSHHSIALLLPLWSLAIEEQFYIVWPFLSRMLSVRGLMLTSVGLLCVEPLVRWGAMSAHLTPDAISYLTPFRLDGLLFGALLAIMDATGSGRRLMAGFGGVFALGTWTSLLIAMELIPSFQKSGQALPFNIFGYSIIAFGSFLTVGYVAWNETGFVSRILSLAAVNFVGRISYGMYLYHEVVLAVARHLLKIPTGEAGDVGLHRLLIPDLAITLGLAFLSYKFIEMPCLKFGKARVEAMKPKAHRIA
jgi:peptidoglycan/LPS O-acetylase OafA/YrhL